MRDVGQERRFAAGQGELDRVVVDFLDVLEQFLEAHAFKVREAHARQFVPRVIRVQLTLEAPDHVVGIHVAGRLEVFGGVELDAFAQVERVRQAVLTDVPGFGQCRNHIGGAGLEVRQAIEDGFGHGVGCDCSRVLDHVEAFGTGFGANHQGFGRDANSDTQQRGRDGRT